MPTPEEVRREADAAVREFAKELNKQDRGTGVRTPPSITTTTVAFDRRAVNLDLDRGAGVSKSFEGQPQLPPGPTGPVGACCIAGVCYITTGAFCTASGGTYHGDGSLCSRSMLA